MLSNVLSQITCMLDRRFLLNAFFPSLVFWGLLRVVFLIGQGNQIETVTAWNQQDSTLKILQLIGFISWATFFAGVLASQLTTILRFYEGYWNIPLRWFKAIGESRYRTKLKGFDDRLERDKNDPCYEEVYLYYPSQKRFHEVMPTRLGNILKSAELYPYLRYKIDAVNIWPRLYNLFPERFILSIGEARSALDFMLVLSFLSGIFALGSGGYLWIVGASWWLFLVCFWGGTLVSWLAYRGALGSAILYAEQIKVAFDLYRNELLKQMRLKLPSNLEEEIDQWNKLDKFLYRNDLTALQSYTDPPEEKLCRK